MKAMLLAAGRGERMRPLTDATPKPLLKVGDRSLIEFHLAALATAGFRDVVINTAWLADQITEFIGDGSRYQLKVIYSHESDGALDTGGGIFNALHLLGNEPFLVINSDIWTNMEYDDLGLADEDLAHLVLVDNPPHQPEGDFTLAGNRVHDNSEERLTFSGVGVYRPELFAGLMPGKFPLAPVLCAAMQTDQVSGEHFQGSWMDIGTPERFRVLNYLVSDDDDGR